jgi:hypothetical protein
MHLAIPAHSLCASLYRRRQQPCLACPLAFPSSHAQVSVTQQNFGFGRKCCLFRSPSPTKEITAFRARREQKTDDCRTSKNMQAEIDWETRETRPRRKCGEAWSVRGKIDLAATFFKKRIFEVADCDFTLSPSSKRKVGHKEMSIMEIKQPVVLARLPRPLLENSHHKCGPVFGQTAGLKRKRHEVSIAIDGNSVNLYEVSRHWNVACSALTGRPGRAWKY